MPKARTIAFLVAAATSLVDHTDSALALAQAQPCGSREYANSTDTGCEVDLAKHTVRLYWKRSDGTPYSYLSSLPRTLERQTGRLLFATNAGMFDPDLKPVGLYVEQGRELVRANTRTGYGNFHMKPNGVFYIAAGRAAVTETQAFLKQRPQADLATQSGTAIPSRIHPTQRDLIRLNRVLPAGWPYCLEPASPAPGAALLGQHARGVVSFCLRTSHGRGV